jgi:uncharacterized protein YutE (UPF0331/DUF86 family)
MFLLHALMPILLDRGESRVETPIVSDRRLGEPRTNRELFDLPQRDAWIEDPLASTLRNMAGFRNVLVHGYANVDLAVVRDHAR